VGQSRAAQAFHPLEHARQVHRLVELVPELLIAAHDVRQDARTRRPWGRSRSCRSSSAWEPR